MAQRSLETSITHTHTYYTISHHQSLKAHSLVHSLSYESYEVQIWDPGCEAVREKEISLSMRTAQLRGEAQKLFDSVSETSLLHSFHKELQY